MHEVCLNGPLFSVYVVARQFFKEEPKKTTPTYTYMHTRMYIWLFLLGNGDSSKACQINVTEISWKVVRIAMEGWSTECIYCCGGKWGKDSSGTAQPTCVTSQDFAVKTPQYFITAFQEASSFLSVRRLTVGGQTQQTKCCALWYRRLAEGAMLAKSYPC